MSLKDNLLSPGAEVFYDPSFRRVFEDHLSLILNDRTNFDITEIDPNTAARFAGDFKGLMVSMLVSPFMHYFNMRVNQLKYSSEYNGDLVNVIILRESVINRLANTYRTTRKK
jgi:hypothetical protein